MTRQFATRGVGYLGKLRLGGIFLLVGLGAVALGWLANPAYGQSQGLIISRVGLSQAQGTTFLTMILSRAEQPRIQPVVDRQNPQLLIDFPGAKVFDVPVVQAGDQQLVKQVRTAALPGEGGVRIILDLVPGKPYTFWRSSREGTKGGYQFMIGIRPDAAGGQDYAPGLVTSRGPGSGSPAPSRTEVAPTPPPAPATVEPARQPEASAVPQGEADTRRPSSSSLGEIYQLMPAAGPVLELLERKGWSVQKNSGGRNGAPGGRKFFLVSDNFPNLSVTAEHIPGRGAGTPAINIMSLSTDRMVDSDADKYRQKLKWDMATIKKHYEDIGDYYDDGLKPFRIRIRERSKGVVLRDFEFFKEFIEAAVPQKPGLADQIKKHIDEKPNKRLEGAQYTESENPLVILDMVDFYTLRVYFLGR